LHPFVPHFDFFFLFPVDNVDELKLQELFNEYDTNNDGKLGIKEVEAMLVKLGVAPMIDPLKKSSASSDRMSQAAVAEEAGKA
jgi:Ca2+-binding EF-hand superfamily protein